MARPYLPWPGPWPVGWRVYAPVQSLTATLGSLLQPADVALFCPDHPDAVQERIIWLQDMIIGGANPPPSPHARFTHVALYVGGDMIIDAVPGKGVTQRPLDLAAQNCHTRVLRFVNRTQKNQQAICDSARKIVGQNYGYFRATVDGLLYATPTVWASRVVHELRKLMSDDERRPFYCSDLIEEAFLKGGRTSFLGSGAVAPLPFVLSQTHELKDAT